jgi:hypothetical protein
VVDSLSPGTGSQFALLPAQNATGNFTKIVQRVPVRIHVDVPTSARDPGAGPVGVVDVDTRELHPRQDPGRHQGHPWLKRRQSRGSQRFRGRLDRRGRRFARGAAGHARHLHHELGVAADPGQIGAAGTEGTWISTGYLMAEIVIIPLTAWLTRVFGLRRFLMWNALLFTAFSMMCGMSHSLTQMVVGRIGQGLPAAR